MEDDVEGLGRRYMESKIDKIKKHVQKYKDEKWKMVDKEGRKEMRRRRKKRRDRRD